MTNLLYIATIVTSLFTSFFASEKELYTARFARIHERFRLVIKRSAILHKAPLFLLGMGKFNRVFCVRSTTTQRELANVLLLGKTRVGKGLNIVTNLLRWPYSVVVNDIKREHWDQTAGGRERGLGGRSLLFDPRGYGHKFDPFAGKTTDSDFRSAATTLLWRPNEGQNKAFTERAITMLVQVFHAARLEGQRLLPFTYKLLNEGLFGVATILKIISEKHNFYPNLATKFLDVLYAQADFDSKFLRDCFSTMTSRMNQILTRESGRSFMGSDFTGRDIITSGRPPLSVYLSWPEKDLLALSPLIQLVWDSLISDMTDTYDSLQGKGCIPTLVVLDEIFRTGMHKLPDYATTVCSRNISLIISAQSRSQMDAEYGLYKANVLRGQIDSIVLYRPAPDDYETQAHIEKLLGYKSGFAHTKNEHQGATSTGENEQRIPLLPAHETDLLGATQVVIKRSGVRPILANRLDWHLFPELEKRRQMPAPPITALPGIEERSDKGDGKRSRSGSAPAFPSRIAGAGRGDTPEKILSPYYTREHMRETLKNATKKAIVEYFVEPHRERLTPSQHERILTLLENLTC